MNTSPPTPDPHAYLLGQIKAVVDGLKDGQARIEAQQAAGFTQVNERINGIDGRLRTVEQKAAGIGAISGGMVAIGIQLIAEPLKLWLKRGGG